MTTLVITKQRFANLADGYDLRAWHLSRELAKSETLVLVPLACSERDRGSVTLDPRDVFEDVAEPLVLAGARPSSLRHLRWHAAQHYAWGHPRYHRHAVELISATLKRHAANRILAIGADLAGFLLPFRSERVVFDVCDSGALYIEREAAFYADATVGEKLRWRILCWRHMNTEKCLPHWFTHVTTVSKQDTQAIRRVSGGCSNVTTIPNGVPPSLERPLAASNGPRKRGIVFWGDLGYGVNARAIRFFHEKVYEPHLAAAGVEWCLVGRGPEPWLEAAARRYPSIRVTGFVEDLYAAVSDYPVVVNPMVSGGGIKNKMLEALALGKAVVSTPLGMESIAGTVDGEHYVAASTPEDMARSVLALLEDPALCARLGSNARRLILARHTWRHVGEKLRSVFESMGPARSGRERSLSPASPRA